MMPKNFRSNPRRCSVKKLFLETLQNSQENTCVTALEHDAEELWTVNLQELWSGLKNYSILMEISKIFLLAIPLNLMIKSNYYFISLCLVNIFKKFSDAFLWNIILVFFNRKKNLV